MLPQPTKARKLHRLAGFLFVWRKCRPASLLIALLQPAVSPGVRTGFPDRNFAPGATGKVATGDLVYLFERPGVPAGIDLEPAMGGNSWLAGVMGMALSWSVGRAGGLPAVL